MSASRQPVVALVGLGTAADVAAPAQRLAAEFEQVVLLDADLYHGALTAALAPAGVTSTIADIAAVAAEDIDAGIAEAISYSIGPAGQALIPSPAHPELADIVDPAALRQLVRVCAQRRPVVIHGGCIVTASVLGTLLEASDVLLVGERDREHVRQAQLLLELLARARCSARCLIYAEGPHARHGQALAAVTGCAPWRTTRDGLPERLRQLVRGAPKPALATGAADVRR